MERIELDQQDVAPGRALRAAFAKFWATAQGEPRAVYDRFVAATPRVPGVTFRDSDLDGVKGVWATPAAPLPDRAILFIHGGGYGLGSADAYRGFVSQLASRAKVAVFALDYPLAPEAQVPVALDLAIEALAQLTARFPSVAISGDSAGGGMTLAALARARILSIPVRAAAVYSPWADLSVSSRSVRDNAISDPMLDPAYLRASASNYLGATPVDDPRASPLMVVPSGLPPVLVQVGTDEILLDDSRGYAEAGAAAGNEVALEEWVGMHHVFQLNVEELASARAALDRAAAFLSRYLG